MPKTPEPPPRTPSGENLAQPSPPPSEEKSSFTPEPWELCHVKINAFVPGHAAEAQYWQWILYGPNREQIAAVSLSPREDANAKLLLSSPRLLRTLKNLLVASSEESLVGLHRAQDEADALLRQLGVCP